MKVTKLLKKNKTGYSQPIFNNVIFCMKHLKSKFKNYHIVTTKEKIKYVKVEQAFYKNNV